MHLKNLHQRASIEVLVCKLILTCKRSLTHCTSLFPSPINTYLLRSFSKQGQNQKIIKPYEVE